jgi:hypothetical protein
MRVARAKVTSVWAFVLLGFPVDGLRKDSTASTGPFPPIVPVESFPSNQ